MKLVTTNNINGYALNEDAIGKPIIVNGAPIGFISGFSCGNGFEDSAGNPMWLEVEIWDCGWSLALSEDNEVLGINYTYPYNSIGYYEEEEED